MIAFVGFGLFAVLVLYAVLGGADFGGGIWDLLAGTNERARRERALIERSMGPVWEANHVWLIFAAVILWTGFPRAFAPIMSGLWVPLTVAVLGIVVRGAAFAFRHSAHFYSEQRAFGAAFALASPLTPFALGCVAGCVASGRVPGLTPGLGPVEAVLHPLPLLAGVFAVLLCAHLGAVFLMCDAESSGAPELALGFRKRSIFTAVLTGSAATAAFPLYAEYAPLFHEQLSARALPVYVCASLCGLVTLNLLFTRHAQWARWSAAACVAVLVGSWGLAHDPWIVPGVLSLRASAANEATMQLLGWVVVAAVVLLGPALALMLRTFRAQR